LTGWQDFSKIGVVWNRGQGRKLFSRNFLPLFRCALGGQAGKKPKKEKITMKLQNLILILILIVCIGLLPKAQATPEPNPPAPGVLNTRDGQSAMPFVTTGAANSAFGAFSQFSLTTGNNNTAVGVAALDLNNADNNTAVGTAALLLNTDGQDNTAVGTAALLNNTFGTVNTAVGAGALLNNTEGVDNNAVGAFALHDNTTGDFNNAHGNNALLNNVDGNGNSAFGDVALVNNMSGSWNTAVGNGAGLGITSGSNNVCVGDLAGINVTTANNVICIGTDGANVNDSCYIGNTFGATVDPGSGTQVFVDSDGKLGTILSSQRFKVGIKPMDKASEAVLALKPVTFHYKSDPKGTPQFGLIAEEVAEVNPGLVVRDKNGEIYTVRYDQVNAMLLNEFLKEHRRVLEQGAMIARQQKQIEALTVGLQRVSAELEMNKGAPQTALNSQ
jgi:trimeric autotransporter adhesin